MHIDGFTMNTESISNKPLATEVQSIAISNGCIDVSKPVCDAASCKETIVLKNRRAVTIQLLRTHFTIMVVAAVLQPKTSGDN